MRRAAREVDVVEGRPHLVVRDEDREAVVDALAELLLAALERDAACRT